MNINEQIFTQDLRTISTGRLYRILSTSFFSYVSYLLKVRHTKWKQPDPPRLRSLLHFTVARERETKRLCVHSDPQDFLFWIDHLKGLARLFFPIS